MNFLSWMSFLLAWCYNPIVYLYYFPKMNELKQDVKDYIIDQLTDNVGLDQYIGDLHHYLLNEHYFIIGYYKAEQWLKKDSIFNAIETIKEYEQDNFGQVSTDLSSSESVANMLAYILADEILNENDTFQLFSRFRGLYDEDKKNLLIDSLKGE